MLSTPERALPARNRRNAAGSSRPMASAMIAAAAALASFHDIR